MKTFVSTNTGAVIQLLPGWAAPAREREVERLEREESAHGFIVFTLILHLLLQYFPHEARDAHALFGRGGAGPRGGLLIEGDRDVLHRKSLQNVGDIIYTGIV